MRSFEIQQPIALLGVFAQHETRVLLPEPAEGFQDHREWQRLLFGEREGAYREARSGLVAHGGEASGDPLVFALAMEQGGDKPGQG